MKVTFSIHFHTVWGQTLHIIGSTPELGSWDTSRAYEMLYMGDGFWSLSIDFPDQPILLEYRYFLISNQKQIFEEWKTNHQVELDDPSRSYLLIDYWQGRPQNLAFYSSAFTKSFFGHPCDKFERVVKSKKKIILKVLAPHVERTQSLALSGNIPELGNWNINKALIFSCEKFPLWSIKLDATKLSFPFEYKFLVIENENRSLVRWENGENRILNLPFLKEKETAIMSGLQFRENSPSWKCAGLVIPVFALRTRNSCGIGDFGDLKMLLDWAKQTSQRIVQLLPINDTTMTHTWMDSYPYNAISTMALHPLYLKLDKMGKLKNPERADYFNLKQTELNQSDVALYEEVDRIKWEFFREIFEQEGSNDLNSTEFHAFFEQNKSWLIPYAAYSYFRELYNTHDFRQWENYARYDKMAVEHFCMNPQAVHHKEIQFYYYIQFHLHRQLQEVRDYAYAHGIVLKGDIPIGISKTSIEAWTEPHYFHMDVNAGAPPDDFSLTGQNWGFPTYNWEEMERDDYAWWKKRFQKMSEYFDAYRMDHILGFFRIWEIPEDSVQGLTAWFNPSLPLSISEIENAGLHFNMQQFTTPHINEYFLHEIFGEYTAEVMDVYLERTTSCYLALKDRFKTQQRIKAAFTGKEDVKSLKIRDGLYTIANEALFIADPRQPDKYHPRISASQSYLYRELNNSDRYAFDNLYWNYYYQRHNEFWKEQGYKHLIPLVSCTDMLVCGEDLGMIPQSVPEVMNKLQIFSLEIERMPKETNIEFANLHTLPYSSVSTTSTHDMSTIRGWWKEDQQRTQRYYNQVLRRDGKAPDDCPGDICEHIINNHLNAPSMLSIIPLQDWLAMDEQLRRTDVEAERINVPANPRHYWRYRMHLNIEELLNATGLNQLIRSLIKRSGRI